MADEIRKSVIHSELPAGLAEHAVDCILLYDLHAGYCRYISPAVRDLLGYTSEEAHQLSVADILVTESLFPAEEIKERAACFMAGARGSEIERMTAVYKCKCRDGSVKPIEISTRLLINPDTGTVDVLGIARDASRWAERENLLARELEEKDQILHKLMASERELASLTLELLAKNEALREKVTTDDMTGLNNRYFFDRRAGEEIERAERYKTPLSMIILDLDRFKNINDTFGHDVGDTILVSTASIIRQNIRKPDILARWGGEEFALVVPQTDLLGSAALAEKLREAIGSAHQPGVGTVTASFGVAEWIIGEPYESWFRRADQALYQAKGKGRNCVVCSSSESGMPISLIRLEWKPVWDCGHPLIDRQHRDLANLANELIELSTDKDSSEKTTALFNMLIENIIHHFTDEEKIIEQAGYPDLPRHAERHQNLIKKVLRLNNSLLRAELTPAMFFTFLVDEVIVGHMLIEDVLYFPYIRKMLA